MRSPLVVVKNVSKAFPIYQRPSDLMLEIVSGRARHDTFWALRDVTFSLREGEQLGIIGPNGSGKSTLLKIITGNLAPTGGSVQVNGRISGMLSLNTTLNAQESGLSNIRFNLILNACPKAELDRLTEEIIEFTELGPFIYAPVRTYSAGMNAKLAFAIATSIEPEILVVDEVLSVGDAYFVGKATQRMIELCDRGRGLIFVSHALSAVQMLCKTVLWIENGTIRAHGPAEQVLRSYEEDYRRLEDQAIRSEHISKQSSVLPATTVGELGQIDICRLRLVQESEPRSFEDTHFVRHLQLAGDRLPSHQVPIHVGDIHQPEQLSALDIAGSEWGRLYARGPYDCRILSARTGKWRGGHVMVKRPAGSSHFGLRMSFASCSIKNQERLAVQYLNLQTGQWEYATQIARTPLENGWEEASYEAEIPSVDEATFSATLSRIELEGRPDMEVLAVQVRSEAGSSSVIREREGFTVKVETRANRLIPEADVGIRIVRSDGVYVFWQSSGLEGINLRNVEGLVAVTFHFIPNYLTAGEYSLSAFCANGWDLKANYPYSRMYDRKLDAASLVVKREFPELDFGLLNMRVAVSVERE